MATMHDPLTTALEAHRRGFTPVPLRPGTKKPALPGWQSATYDTEQAVREAMSEAGERYPSGTLNVGVALGPAHGHLVDIDVDHPLAARIAMDLLPHTPMRHGRDGNPRSHYWYRVTGDVPDQGGHDPGIAQFRLPSKSMIIEYRSTGGHTVLPESIHPDGDFYQWEGAAWGGADGPTEVDATQLHVTVALIAFIVLLADNWPAAGGRHDAYLALAGALMRDQTEDGLPRVMPLWEKNLPGLVQVLSDLVVDEDGGFARVGEIMTSTRKRIMAGRPTSGWPSLAELIGSEHVTQARAFLATIEELTEEERHWKGPHGSQESGAHQSLTSSGKTREIETSQGSGGVTGLEDYQETKTSGGIEERDPLAERSNSWEPVDLSLVLWKGLKRPRPEILRRSDGPALLYPGRVNSLYGSGGSGKTWLALFTAQQVINDGGSVLMIDFEDEPVGTLTRMLALDPDRERLMDGRFTYVCPDEPISPVARDRWGGIQDTEESQIARNTFTSAIRQHDPSLVIVDGVTTLYSIHGLDTNDATSTDVIGRWLRGISDNNRRTTLLIDHTPKTASPGSTPLGSQHKIAMIQGAALQVHTSIQPRPGGCGKARIYVGKDRPGGVMENSTVTEPYCVADVEFDSTVEGHMEIRVGPPDSQTVTITTSGKADTMAKSLDHDQKPKKPRQKKSPSQTGPGRPPKDRSADVDAVVAAIRDGGHALTMAEIRMATGLGEYPAKVAIDLAKKDGRIRMDARVKPARYVYIEDGGSDA